MKKGLLQGKFMPFHEGHNVLINFALAQTHSPDVIVRANHTLHFFLIKAWRQKNG